MIIPEYAGIIAAIPWFFAIFIPTLLLNQIINSYERREYGRGEKRLAFASYLPIGALWKRHWSDLYDAEYAVADGNIEQAIQLLAQLRATQSLTALYATGRILALTGRWDELIHFSKPYSEEAQAKPSFFFTQHLLTAYAAKDEVMQTLSVFEKLREYYPKGSFEERELLTLLAQILPPHRVPKILEELKENRAAKEVRKTPLIVYILGVILVLVFLMQISLGDEVVYEQGVYDPFFILFGGEWWRIITCGFLHVEFLHLGANLLGLLVLGPFLERQLGRIKFFTVFILSSIGASLLVLLLMWWEIIDVARMLGASGGVMGIVGAYAGLYLSSYLRTGSLYYKDQLRNVFFILFLQTLFDVFTPRISFSAHFGGFLTGFLVSLVLLFQKREIDTN